MKGRGGEQTRDTRKFEGETRVASEIERSTGGLESMEGREKQERDNEETETRVMRKFNVGITHSTLAKDRMGE